jgi:hypothetical protein
MIDGSWFIPIRIQNLILYQQVHIVDPLSIRRMCRVLYFLTIFMANHKIKWMRN